MVAVQQRQTTILEGVHRAEMESFEFEYAGTGGSFTGVRYSAPEGQHDDCVVAHALAMAHYRDPQVRKPKMADWV